MRRDIYPTWSGAVLCSAQMSATDLNPDAIYLWRALRHYIEQTCILFGLPSTLAQKVFISRDEHARICAWLRPLEQLLRRLIFLEALKCTPEPVGAIEHKSRAKRIMPAAFGAHFDADNSESWRVQINLNPERRLPAGQRQFEQIQRNGINRNAALSPSKTTSAPIVNVVSSAPVARRIEALIRGFNDPRALAQSYANKIARTPEIADDIVTPPAKRVAALPGWHSVVQAIRLIRAELLDNPAPNSS